VQKHAHAFSLLRILAGISVHSTAAMSILMATNRTASHLLVIIARHCIETRHHECPTLLSDTDVALSPRLDATCKHHKYWSSVSFL
jgi:hypothetical protein